MYHEMHRYPHTNLNEANLDYLCSKIGEVESAADSANEAAELAESVKNEALEIKTAVDAVNENVNSKYAEILETAGELSDSLEQIETNKDNITLLSADLVETNADVAGLSNDVDDIETKAAEIYANAHLINVDVTCTASPANIDASAFSTFVKKYNQLNMVFAKVYAQTARALDSGHIYPIAYVMGATNCPSYNEAMSVFIASHKVADAWINNSGEISIYAYDTIPSGASIYITGFWHIN